MTNENPYQPSESDIDTGSNSNGLDDKTFNHLSGGQKMAIYAIVIFFFADILSHLIGALGTGLLIIFALFLGLIGLIRILLGSQIGRISKVLLFIAMFIPLINLLALVRINYLATKELKAAGYKVGLLGVRGGYVA